MSVRHAMLALLSEGPSYGLQLREEFEARTGDVWPLNVGQVYTTLQRLERDGLVVSEGDDDGPQKAFRITAEGIRELDAWLRTPPALAWPWRSTRSCFGWTPSCGGWMPPTAGLNERPLTRC